MLLHDEIFVFGRLEELSVGVLTKTYMFSGLQLTTWWIFSYCTISMTYVKDVCLCPSYHKVWPVHKLIMWFFLDSISFWCDCEIYDVYSSHGYCCYGVAFFISFYTLRQGTSTDAKSNGFKWRSRTLKGSTGFSYGSTSGNPGVLGIPVEDIAATRIQTAFRAFMVWIF